jgi:bifunctional non-homologous end joining protein LigD
MALHYEPMLLTPTDVLPEGDDWIFEPKLNGYRGLAYVTTDRTRLRSRQGNSLNDQFPDVVQQLPEALVGHLAVLDGEVVGFDQEGRHDLRTIRGRTTRKVYHVFDILELDEEPLIRKPWHERPRLLEASLSPQSNIEVCPHYGPEDREDLLVAARDLALEGIVAKKFTSLYWPGRRSKEWRKLKFNKHRPAFT